LAPVLAVVQKQKRRAILSLRKSAELGSAALPGGPSVGLIADVDDAFVGITASIRCSPYPSRWAQVRLVSGNLKINYSAKHFEKLCSCTPTVQRSKTRTP